MIYYILIFLIIIYILNNSINTENFINFKVPGNGYWCKNIDCNYPVIALLKPNNKNANYMKLNNNSNRIIPYNNYNINPICNKCIISKNKDDCIFFSINSEKSLIKYSNTLIKWFNYIDLKELLKLILKKQFIYENNNLYFVKKRKNIKKLIKPKYLEKNGNLTIADSILDYNNEKFITIQFYIMLFIVYYKLYLIEKKIKNKEKYTSKYTSSEIINVLNKIKKFIKNIKYKKINNNELYQDKLDEFYEKCNIDNRNQVIPEDRYSGELNKYFNNKNNFILGTIENIHQKESFKKKETKFLFDTYNKFRENNKLNNKRKLLFNKHNIQPNLENLESDIFNHPENGIIRIENIEYLFSCGNLYTYNNSNLEKLINCDKYAKLNNYLPDKNCILPKLNTYIKTLKNIKLYNEINLCSIKENEFQDDCTLKEFKYNKLKLNTEKDSINKKTC
jgi:hypothetical protein